MRGKHEKTKRKILLAAIGSAATALAVAGIILFGSSRPEAPATAAPDFQTAVQQLFREYRLDLKSIKTRGVESGRGTFTRTEQRVIVPASFNTLSFNYDLNRQVAHLGATVIATEKSEDKSVTMHIKKDGVICHSIVFIIKKEIN